MPGLRIDPFQDGERMSHFCPECGASVEVPKGEHRGHFSSFSWSYEFVCPKCYANMYCERFGFDYPEVKE